MGKLWASVCVRPVPLKIRFRSSILEVRLCPSHCIIRECTISTRPIIGDHLTTWLRQCSPDFFIEKLTLYYFVINQCLEGNYLEIKYFVPHYTFSLFVYLTLGSSFLIQGYYWVLGSLLWLSKLHYSFCSSSSRGSQLDGVRVLLTHPGRLGSLLFGHKVFHARLFSLALKSAISPRSLVPFSGEYNVKAKIWMLSVLIAPGRCYLQAFLVGRTRGHVMCLRIHIRSCISVSICVYRTTWVHTSTCSLNPTPQDSF